MPKYFRWSDTEVDSTGESYSSAITMGNDPYNGGKDFTLLCENTTGDWTSPIADWRKGLCVEITAEEAESFMQPVVKCDHLHTLYNDQLGCMQCQVCGSEFGN